MPKHRAPARRLEDKPHATPAVVLPFPARASELAAATIARQAEARPAAQALPQAPTHAERPTLIPHTFRDWVRATLIVSIMIHLLAYAAFELRFEGDLERAAGAAAALSSDGTVTIPVDVIVEAALPAAPTPTNASETDAKDPTEIQKLMPEPPEPAPVVLPKPPVQAEIELPPPPEPAPVVLPTREQAARLALPEEASAPPRQVETANVPQSPPAETVFEENPPLPQPRGPIREEQKRTPDKPKPVEERERTKQAARPAPSAAASPSRAAAANSTGSIGGGGATDSGGQAAVSSYQAMVLAHLTRHRIYPPEARERGVTGVARIRFALGRDGRVLSASLLGASGERVLDEAALDMVRRASPFPPFPSGLTQSRMDFAAPIRFDLR
jgi:protein TonB